MPPDNGINLNPSKYTNVQSKTVPTAKATKSRMDIKYVGNCPAHVAHKIPATDSLMSAGNK